MQLMDGALILASSGRNNNSETVPLPFSLSATLRPLLSLLVLMLATGLSADTDPRHTLDQLDDQWRLTSDRKDIKVYMRHTDGSRLKTFRGVLRLPLEDEFAMVALLNDYDTIPRWLHFVDGAEEIERDGPLNRVLRFTTRLPWPLRNREAVLEAFVVERMDDDEESVMVYMENRPDRIPDNPDYIRFPEMEALFGAVRQEGNEVEVIYQVVLDPGGYIPAWLINVLMRDAPYYTLDRLRRIIQRDEYQGHYFDYVPNLRGPGHPDHPHYGEPE